MNKWYLLIILCFGIQSTQAQVTCDSKLLDALYLALPPDCRQAVATGAACTLTQGKELHAKKDGRQTITHIGIRLFPEIYYTTFNPLLLDFIERTALELQTLPQAEAKAKLKEYNMTWAISGQLINQNQVDLGLSSITPDSKFSISKDSLRYTAQWINTSGSSILVQFPARYNLITGKNKMELDNQLAVSLKTYRNNKTQSRKFVLHQQDQHQLLAAEQIYLKKGRSLFIKEMVSDSFFEQNESQQFEPLFDEKYPLESLSNLVLGMAISEKGAKLDINQHKYGKLKDQYMMNMTDFVSYFDTDFEVFWGYQSVLDDQIKMTVLLVNADFNFYNMYVLETNAREIFDPKKQIKTDLYTHIPSHNIKDLFGAEKKGGAQYDIFIKTIKDQ